MNSSANRTPLRPVIDYGVAAFQLPSGVEGSAPLEIRDFEPLEENSGAPESCQPANSTGGEILEISEFVHCELELAESVVDVAFETDASAEQGPFDVNQPPQTRRWLITRMLFATLRGIGWLIRTLFGIASLIVLLALIAAIPVVNFLALGYLLEVEGRVARSGRLRDAFPLLSIAPRLGSIVLGIWLWTIPLRFLSDLVHDIHLVNPGSRIATVSQVGLLIVSGMVTMHLVLALARGGALSTFFRPLKNAFWLRRRLIDGDYWRGAEEAISEFVTDLKLKHHFLLGAKGFLGALAWLIFPTALFAVANRTEGGPILLTLLGGMLLVPVLLWVPFLQAHFAAEGRLSAMFDLQAVRKLYRHAPFMWLVAHFVTFAMALPLYLFKAAVPPRDALWLVTIVFVVSIYPVRVLTGWAYHRAKRRERPTHWLWRWLWWLPSLPVAALYVFILYFTQFVGKYGKLTLFEHHLFLVPSPYSFFN